MRLLSLAKMSLPRLGDPLYRTPVILILSSLLNAVFGFLFWVIAARYYPVADVGVVAALTSASGLVAMLASLGFPTGLLRFLPTAVDKRSVLNSALVISSAASVLLAGLFIAGTPVWSRDLTFLRSDLSFLISFILVSCGTALASFQAPAFIALRRPGLSMVHATVCLIIRIPFAILLARFGQTGLWASWGLTLMVNFVLFSALLRIAQPGYLPTPSVDRQSLKVMAPFSFATLWADIPAYAATAIIPLMALQVLGPEATAYYYVGYRVGSIVLTVATFTGMSLLVEGAHDATQLNKNVARAVRFTAILLAPTLLVIFLFGDKILQMFGGLYSSNALPVVYMISVAGIPHVVTEFYIAVKRVKLQMRPIVIMAWASLALNLLFAWPAMKLLGVPGTGAGWLASYAIVAAAIGVLTLRRRMYARHRSLAKTEGPR